MLKIEIVYSLRSFGSEKNTNKTHQKQNLVSYQQNIPQHTDTVYSRLSQCITWDTQAEDKEVNVTEVITAETFKHY